MIATVPHYYEGQRRNVGRDTLLSSVLLPFTGAPMTFISLSPRRERRRRRGGNTDFERKPG